VRHSALSYIVLVSVVAATPAAHAQVANPSSRLETVTVTAAKLDLGDIIRSYVKGFAAPSPYLGKIARWKSGVCPKVMGLQPDAAALVADRITAVAKIVGAPVASEPCRTNVEIVVTPQPQALLDALREKRPDVFGYSSGPSQTASMAIMNRPIQAWYVTVTEDYAGILHRDEMLDDCAIRTGRRQDCSMLVSGFSLSDGLKSDFVNAIVVVDSSRIGALQIGALADYAAMEALAQTQAADDCRALPTVTNLVSAGCPLPNKSGALTETDIAYLHALYRVQPDAKLNMQEHQISHDMQKSLSGSGKP
jgi:hypothetical protein